MSDASFAAKNAHLIDIIRTAREEGEERPAFLALQELLTAYKRLGSRDAGTVDEQNAYIVARRLGSLPEALVELGVSEQDLPMPAGRRAPSPPPESAGTGGRISARFACIGGRDEPAARFTVECRPQDNMLYAGRPAPYAVVDQTDGLPVAWYPDRDWAAHTADTASRLRGAG